MAKINKKFKRSRAFQKKMKQAASLHGLPVRQNLLQEAFAHIKAGRLSEAEVLYKQILLAEPNNPDVLHHLGMLAHQNGRNETALELIRKAISFRPGYVNAHNNLGIILNGLGRVDEAVASFRQALSMKPDFVEALFNLGYALFDQGKLEEALVSFNKALSLKPDYVNAYNSIGIILHQLGKLDEAVASFRQALSLKPDFTEAYYNLGIILHDLGKLDEAASSFRQALSVKPAYVEAYYNLGIIFHDQGKLEEAAVCYRKAISLKPDYAEAYNNLGSVLNDQDKMEEAIANFRQAISLKPDYAQAYNNLGNVLDDQDELDEAIACYRKAVSLKPDYAQAYYNLGFSFSQSGMIDDAVACYRKALSVKPDYVQAYEGLFTLVKAHEVDGVIRKMEEHYAEGGISISDRIDLGFTLGKVFEDIKEYEKSFEFIHKANMLKRGSYTYSIQKDYDLFERIKKIFSTDFFASLHDSGCRNKTPVFILGMPRSGTTLVEQIISSHPLVFGAGELDVLEDLAIGVCKAGGAKQFPECIPDLSQDVFERTGADYIEKIRKFSKDVEYITDKLPHNFLRVGFIKTILPNAKVIHCMRDPMATCYSIFKHDFKGGHKYAYDMEELGRYYNFYKDLMAHWETVLPGFMHTVRYEEIIADQRNQTKSLLDFCGLPWDEVCLAFHRSKRRVWTASIAQVRQSLYKDSIELWKRYEKQLEPLRKALYGYGSGSTVLG